MLHKKLFKNERDVEIPSLLKFVADRPGIKSVLDVGIVGAVYIKELGDLVDKLDGLDVNKIDKKDKHWLNNYFRCDVMDFDTRNKYDLICSISAVEHYGIKLKNDPVYCKLMQFNLLMKLSRLTNKYLFVTFPYGKEGGEPGEFINLTAGMIDSYKPNPMFTINMSYYFNATPSLKKDWKEISKIEADKVPYKKEVGVQCIAILEGEVVDH